MAVLALGLSRMGTESLRQALLTLGYDHVYHGFDVMHGGPPIRKAWSELGRRKYGLTSDTTPVTAEDLDQIIGHCEAVTDQPCACFALELIEGHPDAKVILNYRDEESWFQSVQATFLTFISSWEFRYLSFLDTFLYWRAQSFVYYEQGFFQGSTLRHAKRVYKEHRAMVRGSVPADRLLEWKVQDGWEPLCTFLGKPVPDMEFPNGNTPAQLRKASVEASKHATQRAYFKLGGFIAVLGVLLVYRVKIK
nr:hypothetical protein CFP56_16867 [Quercus suber]